MYIGTDNSSVTASNVEQIVDTTGTVSKLYCSDTVEPHGGSTTLTFQYATSWGAPLQSGPTCTITSGANAGTSSGGSPATLAPGYFVVVNVTGTVGNGIVTWSAGP